MPVLWCFHKCRNGLEEKGTFIKVLIRQIVKVIKMDAEIIQPKQKYTKQKKKTKVWDGIKYK